MTTSPPPGTDESADRPDGPESVDRPETAEERREREIQVNLSEANSAWKSVAYLITGPLIYGGLGWLLDQWLGTTWLVGAGIVGGMALSLYLIWFRYGTH